MKVIYDPDTDTLSIIFRDEAIAESDELREGLVLDYDRNGRIVSIELLDASENVSEPRGVIYEIKEMKAAI
ncbi:MAG: DUF2283 domain-containing protein [Deltaproteobacteria bacterium]|jgi:uncharacterized protein YuzE|nr:DUF2283 domain-containing protein [Deltaproteobacteria bacterium]MDP2970951.1 DUF2283 domain-containing protein [Deltaproteobacteria bacterium]